MLHRRTCEGNDGVVRLWPDKPPPWTLIRRREVAGTRARGRHRRGPPGLVHLERLPRLRAPRLAAVLEAQPARSGLDELAENRREDQAVALVSDHQRGGVVLWRSGLDEPPPAVGMIRLREGPQVKIRLAVLGPARGQHEGALGVLGRDDVVTV